MQRLSFPAGSTMYDNDAGKRLIRISVGVRGHQRRVRESGARSGDSDDKFCW